MQTNITVPRTNSTVAFTPGQARLNQATLKFTAQQPIITATLEIATYPDGVTYALLNPMRYMPETSSFVPLTDQELKVSARDFDTAKAIFWPAYRRFVQQLTGQRIHTEITKILRLDFSNEPINTARTEPDQVTVAARKQPKLSRKELELAQESTTASK